MGLREAAIQNGDNERDFLLKCKDIQLPLYFSPRSSFGVWELKSISNDPAYSSLGQLLAQELGPVRGPRAQWRRYTEKELPLVRIESQCFFKLTSKHVDEILQKGAVRTEGFTELYELREQGMAQRMLARPSEADASQIQDRVKWPKTSIASTFQDINYSKVFYLVTSMESGLREPCSETPITLGYSDIYIERSQYLKFKDCAVESDAELIFRIFPELEGSIGADNATNQMPEQLVAILAICIRAWMACREGESLKSVYNWIKTTLEKEEGMSFPEGVKSSVCTLCAHSYEYSKGDITYEISSDTRREGRSLSKLRGKEIGEQIRESGILVLIDAWISFFKDEELWDDDNKKPDVGKAKTAAGKAGEFMERYISARCVRLMLPTLKSTKPWQDN